MVELFFCRDNLKQYLKYYGYCPVFIMGVLSELFITSHDSTFNDSSPQVGLVSCRVSQKNEGRIHYR